MSEGVEDPGLDPVRDHVIEGANVPENEEDPGRESAVEKDLLISKRRSRLRKNSIEDRSVRENGEIIFSVETEMSKMR